MLRQRRLLMQWLLGSALFAGNQISIGTEDRVRRLGLTPVFVDDQLSLLDHWRSWLSGQIGAPLDFVQRGSYREVIDLLLQAKLDGAWLCGYPYLRHRQRLKLVAVPVWRGRPLYQSYLIVNTQSPYQELADLRARIFVYSDPDSNSGYLYPRYRLYQSGEDPQCFFARTFFAWSHRAVIESVAVGLADGGAVDGYVWETLAKGRPDFRVASTRVIERSPWFGFPPIVAQAEAPPRFVAALRQALLAMASDLQGVQLLARLHLDGFTLAEPGLYDGIREMMERIPS